MVRDLLPVSPEDATALRAAGTGRRYRKGATLFTEGERADAVMYLLSGRVKLCRHDLDGEETMFDIAGPGELLGELAAIDGQPRSASGIALDDVDARVISATELNDLLLERPTIATALLRLTVQRLRDSDDKRVELATQDTLGRVAARLLELADRFGEEDGPHIRITLPLSQEELAAWTGSSREAVVKALRSLRSRGVIETARREIRVCDRDALAASAR